MLKIYYKNIRNSEIKEIDTPKKGSWIHVYNPSEEEIKKLESDFNLEEGVIKDALDPNEVPRVEVEDGIKYIFTRFPFTRNGKIETQPILTIICEDMVITVSQDEPLFVKTLLKRELNTTQKTKLFIHFLKLIDEEYKYHINSISKKIKNMSSNIENFDNKEITEFVTFERTLNEFLSSLVPTHLIFERILYGKIVRLYEEDAELIEDLSLSNTQLIEISKSSLKYIVNIREAYSTILSNNLNKTMKFLTSVTIILTIPTIISSFYGMNVHLPMDSHPFAFLGILAGTVFISTALLIVFAKNKLL